MLLTSWLCGLRRHVRRPAWRARGRRPAARVMPVAAEVQMVEVLEGRALLSGVLADATPITTPVALEGTSTGNVVLATLTDATPATGVFTTLDPPGAYQSHAIATGVSGNYVAGVYWDASNIRHAFVYDGSTYTTLTPPGGSVEGSGFQAGTTYATGISGNNVVGWFQGADLNTHGFLFNGSTYTTLDPPGSISSMALAVSGNNVVGTFTVAGGFTTGYLFDGSTYTTLVLPSNVATAPTAVSGNHVVGTYSQAGSDHGFLFDGTSFSTFDVPGGLNTTPTGISGNTLVGVYYTGGSYHRFSYDGTTFDTNIDPPWGQSYYYSSETGTTAIDGNNIVGSYIDAANGNYHGFVNTGSIFTTIDAPEANYTQLTGISGNNVVGEYQGNGGVILAFLDQMPPVAANFTPSVDWGGALIGSPTISVQLVSQSPAATTWQVVGSATYAATGNHTVAVTVGDSFGNSVQTNHTTIAVSSLDGQYAVSSSGNPPALASVTQSGAQLTLVGSSTTTAAFTSPTTLLVGGSDSATYGNSTITFGSTGTFANQIWTKLDLPPNFTNQSGAPVHVIQNGTSVTFVDKFGGTSPGIWISPTQLTATAWSQTVTTAPGRLLWQDGSTWSENLVLTGANNGVGTTTIAAAPSQVSVFDYLNSSGMAVHLVQTGTTNVIFIDATGHMSVGTFISPTQLTTPYFPNDVATISNNMATVTWQDGNVWTKTAPTAAITVTHYTNQNGVPVHLIQNGTNQIGFVDGLGRTSLGTMQTPTTAMADLYPGDMAHISGNTVTWDDGYVWTQTNVVPLVTTFTDTNGAVSHVQLTGPAALIGLDGALQGLAGTRQNGGKIAWTAAASPPLTVTDYFNAGTGQTAHVIQNTTNSAVFINEKGDAVLGTFSSPTQATVPAWANDVATFGGGQIHWSDGSVWTQTTVAAPQLVVSDYVNNGNGRTAHTIQTTTNAVIFVNESGAFALGTRTGPTQATVPAWGNDVATFSTGQINWSDGALWTLGSANLWNNLDLGSLNALFQMGTGYP